MANIIGRLDGMGIALGSSDGEVEKAACVHGGDEVCRYRMTWT